MKLDNLILLNELSKSEYKKIIPPLYCTYAKLCSRVVHMQFLYY